MFRIALKWITLITLIVLALYLWRATHQSNAPPTEEKASKTRNSVNVDVSPVTNRVISKELYAQGTLEAINQTTLSAEVDGTLYEILAEEGQIVNKGDKIFQFNNDRAQAELIAAQADLAAEREKLKSYKYLMKQGAVSRNEVTQLEIQVKNKEADEKAKKVELDKYLVEAPFVGELGEIEISAGANVNKGDELVRIVDRSKLEVDYTVDEKRRSEIALGQKVFILVPGRSEDENIEREGKVTFISPEAKKTAGAFIVKAIIDNRDLVLSPEVGVQVRHIVDNVTILAVPESALSADAAGNSVFKVSKGHDDNGKSYTKVEKIKVDVTVRSDGFAGLKFPKKNQALTVQDFVVKNILRSLDDGDAITINQINDKSSTEEASISTSAE